MPITYDPPLGVEISIGSTLDDGGFELDGFSFGGESDSVVVQPGGFDPGTAVWRVQDQDSPSGDGIVFGRDLLTGPTWGFTFLTNEYTAVDALDSLEALAGLWLDSASRSVPGAVSTLRYRIGGHRRRVYGRPRRWGMSVTPDLWGGVAPAVADFVCVDALHYDDELRTVDVGVVVGDGASSGGMYSPLSEPLSTVGGGARSGVVDAVGGTAPSPFIVSIHGPITNPWVAGPGWRFDFRTTLSVTQILTVDTRPWAKTALRQDGASLAGTLTRASTALPDARLLPGGGAWLDFGGIDGTGTATCVVSWRPTYHSL
jgi:hypothetical protein